ncbi:hypothetical protein PG989_006671 [Apiospora arundinis]
MSMFDGQARVAPEPVVRTHPNLWYRDFNPDFKIVEKPVHDKKQIRIVAIGAGASGLLVAYKAARQLSNVSFVVYEKSHDVGGTWLDNRYPGVEIDSPSHTYQWTFAPNPNWSRFMSPGHEVQQYLKNWAAENDVIKDVKLGHTVESAIWNEPEGVWEIKGSTENGLPFTDRAEIVFSCTGCLNNPKFPNVPGMDKFQGKVVHSARWPEDLDLTDKTVALVGGSGATGVQIVPAIQPIVKKLSVFLRSTFWAVPGTGAPHFTGPEMKNFAYLPEQLEALRTDPGLLRQYATDLEDDLSFVHSATHVGGEINQALEDLLHGGTIAAFGEKKAQEFLPGYGFGCRRSAPVHDFAHHLQSDNVETVRASLAGFTEHGIIDSNGTEREVDVVILATGFHPSVPIYDIVGRNERNLAAEIDSGKSYLSIMHDGFPNMFYLVSHNSPVNHGSFLPMAECYVRYAMKMVAHMQRTDIRAFSPSAAAVEEYYTWTHELMKRLTLSNPCHSWFKRGKDHGPVTAVYAGSRGHFYEIMKEPRYEDFDVVYCGSNRFAHFGNGFARAELTEGADRVWYLDELRKDHEAGKEAYEVVSIKTQQREHDTNILIPKAEP